MKNSIDNLAELFLVIAIIIIGLLPLSCTNERNPNSLPDIHPTSWINIDSPDFHGNIVAHNSAGSCTKCHGNDLNGGIVKVSCSGCHSSLSNACTRCHGGYNVQDKTGAPPYGLHGEISDTTIAVGAHISHLRGSYQFAKIPCESCHRVPPIVLDSTHLDYNPFGNAGPVAVDSIAEITWGSISNKNGNPIWDRSIRTCAKTYCHGDFPGGYSDNAPIWTDTNQAACGSCHDIGTNPTDLAWKHQMHIEIFSLRCVDCHYNVVDSALNIVDSSLHVNGVIDTLRRDTGLCNDCHGIGGSSCTYCHGGIDNQTGAPPKGLRGEILTTTLAVGAHTRHMEGGNIADAGLCSDCHITPTSITSPGHFALDSIAEITWGDLSNLSGGASWNRSAHTCAATYCHGNFTGGNTANTPDWTASSQTTCGSCHDVGSNPATLSGRHQDHLNEGKTCYNCHAGTVNSSNAIVGLNLHVNGQKNVVFWNGSGSYSPTSKTCTNPGGCHETETWNSSD